MASENKSKVSILTNGIIKENPVLRLVLGTCSCLAVTTAVSSALGMGAAFTFVLVCSNILISLLRNVIPAKVHLPCYIVIIAGFVTIVQMVMHAYMDSLYTALGVFLPPDRCQLHHSGPCRDVCLQEQCGRFRTGRHRHGHRLHPHRGADGLHP